MNEKLEGFVEDAGGGRELVEKMLASGFLSPADLAALAVSRTAPRPTVELEPGTTLRARHTTIAMAGDELELPTMSLPGGAAHVAPAPAPKPAGKSPSSSGDTLSVRSTAPGSPGADDRPRYEMGKVLGKGGMGEVRLATDTSLGREIALKRMLDASDVNSTRRFVKEARVTGRLEHPNIIPVHELGYGMDGAPYFTMKRVKGDSLGGLIAKLKTGDAEALARYGTARRLTLFLGICNAVAFAHSHGVLHRDLKPANVMVGEFGEVLVMDWGLVRIAGESSDELLAGVEATIHSADGETERTQLGAVVGTPRYMSPEQARGDTDSIDERSDVFALGTILCELLALRPAIPGGSIWQVLEATTRGMRQLPGSLPKDPPCPRELIAVIDKAMALEPDQRYASVRAFAKDIEAFLEGQMLSAADYTPLQRAVLWVRRHKMLAVGAAAGLLAMVLGIAATISLLRRQAVEQAAAHLAHAQELRRGGNAEEAQTYCIAALALVPESTAAQELLGRTSGEADEQRRLRLKHGRIVELATQLETSRRELAEKGSDADLRGWLGAQTRALHAARELTSLYPEEQGRPHREAAILAARAIARRMSKAGETEMAELMLAEARQLGSASEELDRRVIAAEASRRARETADAIERELANASDLQPDGPTWHRLLAQVREHPEPEVVRALVRLSDVTREDHYHPFEAFAVEALGAIGDRTTIIRVPVNSEVNHGDFRDADIRDAAPAVLAELLGPTSGFRIEEHDSAQFLAFRLVACSAATCDIDMLMRHTRAVVAYRDPRLCRALALKRWLVGRDSLYWELSQAWFDQRVEPPDLEAQAASWPAKERALYAEATGRFALALAAYDELVDADPTGPWVARRGRCRLDAGQVDLARVDAESAIGAVTHRAAGLRLRAAIASREARFEPALADLDVACTATVLVAPLHLERARILDRMERFSDAVQAAERALDADPSCLGAYRLLARIRVATGDPTQALVAATAALALAPTDAASYALRADACLRLGIPLAARADGERARIHETGGVEHRLGLSRAWLAIANSPAGNREAFYKARDLAAEVALKQPDLGEAYELQGRAMLLDGSSFVTAALERFRTARTGGYQPARMAAWEGVVLVQLGRYAEAEAGLARGLTEPDPVSDWFMARSRILVANDQLDAAAKALDRAVELDPKGGMPLLEYARLELRRNAPDRAIELLLAAAERPNISPLWQVVIREMLVNQVFRRGIGRAQAGNRAGALSDVELALRYPTAGPELREELLKAQRVLRGG